MSSGFRFEGESMANIDQNDPSAEIVRQMRSEKNYIADHAPLHLNDPVHEKWVLEELYKEMGDNPETIN